MKEVACTRRYLYKKLTAGGPDRRMVRHVFTTADGESVYYDCRVSEIYPPFQVCVIVFCILFTGFFLPEMVLRLILRFL